MTPATQKRAATLGLALTGAAVFHLLGLPLPFLFGPMSACLLAALAGAPLKGLGTVSTLARTVLGVAVGASITPEVVGRLPQMAGSVALVPVYVVLIGLVGVPFFRRLGYDPVTAWYAAMPGGLQDMVSFGVEAGGDGRALALIHATRVLVIVTLAPLILTGLYGAGLTGAVGAPALALPVGELALMAVAAVIGWKGAERVGLFGASILGPMILTAILSISGIITHRPPAEIIWAAQFFIGIAVGVKYAGITLRELRIFVGAGAVYAVVLAMISLGFIEVIHLLDLAPPMDAFLGYLPGGQAEMVVIAILAGADLAFVVSHHLLRIVLVIMIGPLVERRLRR